MSAVDLPADYPAFQAIGYGRPDIARSLQPYSPATVLMLHEAFYFAVSPWLNDPESSDGDVARELMDYSLGGLFPIDPERW